MFITFEGSEGSGKTTQITLLAEFLREQGFSIIVTREPGGTDIAEQIRDVLHHIDNTAMTSEAEILLYSAARAQHVGELIRPALTAGKVVLCDRFADSTMAYQGYGRGLDWGRGVWRGQRRADGYRRDSVGAGDDDGGGQQPGGNCQGRLGEQFLWVDQRGGGGRGVGAAAAWRFV